MSGGGDIGAIARRGTPQALPLTTRIARRRLLERLAGLEIGRLEIVEEGARHRFGSAAAGGRETAATAGGAADETDGGIAVEVEILDPRAWPEIALHGALGAGEAYVRGWWRAGDLTALVRLFLLNRHVLERMESGIARLGKPLLRLAHRARRNTRTGSRENIRAHYDLGDELFELFLDERMMYSAAWYETPQTQLDRAALAKIERLCAKLDLRPGHRVLEIGSGWGALAVFIARRYGCRVTTVTLSRNQREAVRRRAEREGVADRVEALLCDYRELDTRDGDRYDRIVSVEMVEAVGHEYFESYFTRLDRLLEDDGVVVLQAITMADQNYEHAVKAIDFIKRYVFPGGCLPSVTAMLDILTAKTALRLFHLEDLGFHYARTLRDWRARFESNLERVRALGYPESFVRTWRFYLSYCEAAFLERAISNVQLVLAKPGNRSGRAAFLPG